jgi:hypothetical protein
VALSTPTPHMAPLYVERAGRKGRKNFIAKL